MIRSARRSSILLLIALLTFIVPSTVFTPTADAQASVVGAADFRNAPQLPPGEYRDTIVTGDTAWYSLIYTNSTPYRFEVSLLSSGDAEVTTSFVAPTLAVVAESSSVVEGSGVEYPLGHTNEWFLKVSIAGSQDGVEYPVLIRVEGVQEAGRESCLQLADCTYTSEYETLTDELAIARESLADQLERPTLAQVQRDIENLEGFIETKNTLTPASDARLARAEEQMAFYCAPEPFCDEFPAPKPTTPFIGLILGLAVFAFGAYRALKKFQATKPDDQDDENPPARPEQRSQSKFAMGSGS